MVKCDVITWLPKNKGHPTTNFVCSFVNNKNVAQKRMYYLKKVLAAIFGMIEYVSSLIFKNDLIDMRQQGLISSNYKVLKCQIYKSRRGDKSVCYKSRPTATKKRL
jgi:hypothetical protein